MSKKNDKPGLDSKLVDAVVQRALEQYPDVLTVEDTSAYRKVISKTSGNKVYVQLGDNVHEVHLSGFGEGFAGTTPPGKKNGKVQAHLDVTSDSALDVLWDALVALASSEASAKPPTARAKKEPKQKADSDSDRLEKVKARAAALGLGVDSAADEQPSADA